MSVRLPRVLLRLDHAAAELNPVLTVLAIGLSILNVVAVLAMVPYASVGRTPPGTTCVTSAGGAVDEGPD